MQLADTVGCAASSNRWADPRARLLDGPQWEAVAPDVLARLSLDMPVENHLAELARGLDAAWRQMADRMAEARPDAKVEVVVPPDGGRARLSVDKLGAVGEPESLTWLKLTRTRLSHVDQNYLRGDTIAAANALLIAAQSQIPLARCCGGGHLAPVDGVRFVVPARTINATQDTTTGPDIEPG